MQPISEPPHTPPRGPAFEDLLKAAPGFWEMQTLPEGDQVILVDLMCMDLRVALRNLTIAQALRRLVPARLVALTGIDPLWRDRIWGAHDATNISRLGSAYGVEAEVDYEQLIDTHADAGATGIVAGNRELVLPPAPPVLPDWFEEVVHATAARLESRPRVRRDEEPWHRAEGRIREILRINTGMLASWKVAAVVTAHVDYAGWGPLVEQALQTGVPVLHVQSTGAAKAYAVFPEHRGDERSLRHHVTLALGREHEERVWPRRDELRHSANVTTWRSRHNLGRPSWWRGEGRRAHVQFRNDAERAVLRRRAARRLGWDPQTPVVSVFNHAVSDALDTNHEAFADLATWFEQTADYAARHPEVNWLLLDHPNQDLYDDSGFFADLAARHRLPHLQFHPSPAISKTSLWSLTDLVLTVRGSVSNEFPAFGVPAIQAGWSEWSAMGFTRVCDTPEDYWTALDGALPDLIAGRELITDEQVEAARLWMWLYRSGADVVSPLVPTWAVGEPDELCSFVETSMRQVEADADPLFVAVDRMWTRREPWLTRIDLGAGADVTAQLAPPAVPPVPAGPPPGGWLSSTHDDDTSLPLGEHGEIRSSQNQAVRVIEHVSPGMKILGRVSGTEALLGVLVGEGADDLRVRLRLSLDPGARQFWQSHGPDDSPLPTSRRLEVVAQGRARAVVELGETPSERGQNPHALVDLDVDTEALGPGRLLLLEVHGVDDPAEGIGVRIDSVHLYERGNEPPTSAPRKAPAAEAAPEPQRRGWRERLGLTPRR